jgi:uncharacterized protein (TIGR03086 family)
MPTDLDVLRSANSRAVLASLAVADLVGETDLGRPTPCAGWSVADLLAHMTAQHVGFAAAAYGDGANTAVWQVVHDVEDPVASYRYSVGLVLTAFETVDREPFALPEISTAADFPPMQAIGFHLVDYVAHTWDLARALDVDVRLDPDVVDMALRIAHAVPDSSRQPTPGAAFAQTVRTAADASPLEQFLGLLGRSPAWVSGVSAA